MNESFPGTNPDDQDPTLPRLQDVIETMTGGHASIETAGAAGATATGAASTSEGSNMEAGASVTSLRPEVTHDRPKPADWDALAEFASTLPVFKRIDTYGAVYEEASVDALRKKLQSTLDNDALDEHRYYGIGTILCGLAQEMQDPQKLEKAIETTGERLFSHWLHYGSASPHGFLPEDISGTSASAGFADLVRRTVSQLPPHLQLLNDVLAWQTIEREFSIRYGGSPDQFASLNRRGPGAGEYKAGEGTARIGDATTAATARVLRAVVTLRAGYLADHEPDFPANPTALQVIDHTDMHDINLIPVAQRAAAIRLDELQNLEDIFISLDENGRAVFNGKMLPKQKDLKPPDWYPNDLNRMILHRRRLRCPAIFVEGLIPMMMDSIIGGVKVADRRVTEWRRPTPEW